MAWWVITWVKYWPEPNDLVISAKTNYVDHCRLAWAFHKPRRKPIYRKVRGVLKFCGYQYIWDTPFVANQIETGETWFHGFGLHDLPDDWTIWCYVFAPGGPYGLEIQGPLMRFSYAMPEDISCRLWSPIDQTIPINTWTALNFLTSLWDTDTMHDPVLAPTKIISRTPGKFQISGNLQYVDTTGGIILLRIILNDITNLAQVQALSADGAPVTLTSLALSTLYILAVDDYLTLETYHDGPLPNYDIESVSLYSPAFMAIKIA